MESPLFTDRHDLIACPDCDLLHRIAPLEAGQKASCRRCGAVLYRHRPRAVEQGLALTLAALVLFAIATSLPLLSLKMSGQIQETSLLDGVRSFIDRGDWGLALLVFLTSLLFPLLRLLGLLYVLFPLWLGRSLPGLGRVFRLTFGFTPWSMLEIYLLGALVAVVKLGEMATIVPGLAAYAFVGLILASAWAAYTLEPKLVWDRVEVRHGR